MDKTKLIENIKSQLKKLITNEIKFIEVKAGDIIITSQDEELLVGSEVFLVDADGNNVPLTDGSYTLDSGETLTVTGGKIEAIVKEEQVEEPVAEAVVEEPAVEPDVTIETPGENTMESLMEELKKCMERIAKCEASLEEMGKCNTKMEQELEKVKDQPAVKSIELEKVDIGSNDGKVDISLIRERIRKNNR